MISPVAAWMTRMSRSWMSMMMRVPSRVRPRPMRVELAVDAHADVAVVDAVVSDPELVVSGLIAGAGFGPGGVGDGWCRALWE